MSSALFLVINAQQHDFYHRVLGRQNTLAKVNQLTDRAQ